MTGFSDLSRSKQEPDERSSADERVTKVAAMRSRQNNPVIGPARKLIVEEPAVHETRMHRVGVWPAPVPKPVIENGKHLCSCSVETLPAPVC